MGCVAVPVEEQASLVDVGAEESSSYFKGTVLTSAVDKSAWGSSRWPIAFDSSHEQQMVVMVASIMPSRFRRSLGL